MLNGQQALIRGPRQSKFTHSTHAEFVQVCFLLRRAQSAAEKAAEKEARKAEKQAILAAESAELATMKGVKAKGTKTKGSKLAARRAAAAELAALQAELAAAGAGGGAGAQWSTGIDSALDAAAGALRAKKASAEAERHPERRQKAAYAAWEEVQMPLLKEEYPGLRRSQLKEKLHTLWKKAPENPMNAVNIVEYNAKVDDSIPSEAAP